jgi:ferric-dicitrate binding protein FerR (iron transport regulator)
MHADLHSVCDEIGRQLGVQIKITDSRLDTLTVTGLIRGSDARQLLSALCDLTGTKYRMEQNSYVVY